MCKLQHRLTFCFLLCLIWSKSSAQMADATNSSVYGTNYRGQKNTEKMGSKFEKGVGEAVGQKAGGFAGEALSRNIEVYQKRGGAPAQNGGIPEGVVIPSALDFGPKTPKVEPTPVDSYTSSLDSGKDPRTVLIENKFKKQRVFMSRDGSKRRIPLSGKYYEGSNLIYDCTSQHFACIDNTNMVECEIDRTLAEKNYYQFLGCAPLKTYTLIGECQKMQAHLARVSSQEDLISICQGSFVAGDDFGDEENLKDTNTTKKKVMPFKKAAENTEDTGPSPVFWP